MSEQSKREALKAEALDLMARRVAACIHACAGIPTEALESGALGCALQALSDAATPPGTLSRRTVRIRAQESLRALGRLP